MVNEAAAPLIFKAQSKLYVVCAFRLADTLMIMAKANICKDLFILSVLFN